MKASIFPQPPDADAGSTREWAREQRQKRRAARRAGSASAAAATTLACNPLRKKWLEEQDHFYRLCLAWTNGNTCDAEDVIGQAWVKILELDEQVVQSIRKPGPWIAKMLRNLCVDRVRTTNRVRVLVHNDVAVPTPQPAPAPDLDISRKQLAEALAEAVARLPDNLRDVVLLRLINEQSYADIGHTLDISVPNARKRVQQARALLRPELAQFWDERERDAGLALH